MIDYIFIGLFILFVIGILIISRFLRILIESINEEYDKHQIDK